MPAGLGVLRPGREGRPVMHSRFLAALLLLVLLTGCSGADKAEPPASATPTASTSESTGAAPFPPVGGAVDGALAAKLQTEIDRWVREGYLPGLTVALVTKGQTWSGAAGVDGAGTPLTPETGLAIASITKTFVAAEVMTLVQQGLVDLDAPASTYVTSPLLSKGATVRHLLAMRSGLPQQADWETYIADPRRVWSATEALRAMPSTGTAPGEEEEYNNANYWILGLVIEKVRKAPLEEVLARDIFRPAGLERISLQSERPLAPPLGQPLIDVPGLEVPEDNGGFLPFRAMASSAGAAGGMVADALTVARWGYQLYGGQVLEATSLAAMTEFDDDFYGLGTMDISQQSFNIDAVGHEGEILGYRSVLAVFRHQPLAVAILSPSTADTGAFVQYLVKAGGLTGS
jgi:CubicO group peptidase (beta-lactamase class C family)